MSETKITVNGKLYKSPEEMPPDVRQQYEQAMRMMGSALAGTQEGATTRVDTSSRGHAALGDVVIQRTVTVSKSTTPGLNLVVAGRPKLQAFVHFHPSEPAPLPIEPSRMPSEGRRFVYDIAFWVIVGLALWFWLGRY